MTLVWISYALSACACCFLTIWLYSAFLISRSRCASACLASERVSASTRSWSALALPVAASRSASARLMVVSRSASAVATSASRLIRATSGRPMLAMYSFLSLTSLMVKEITSSPILLISSAQVERMRSETISGCFTISSTVSWPMMPRRWPHHQADETLTLLVRLSQELFGRSEDGFGVRFYFDLGDGFDGDGDALLG